MIRDYNEKPKETLAEPDEFGPVDLTCVEPDPVPAQPTFLDDKDRYARLMTRLDRFMEKLEAIEKRLIEDRYNITVNVGKDKT